MSRPTSKVADIIVKLENMALTLVSAIEIVLAKKLN